MRFSGRRKYVHPAGSSSWKYVFSALAITRFTTSLCRSLFFKDFEYVFMPILVVFESLVKVKFGPLFIFLWGFLSLPYWPLLQVCLIEFDTDCQTNLILVFKLL